MSIYHNKSTPVDETLMQYFRRPLKCRRPLYRRGQAQAEEPRINGYIVRVGGTDRERWCSSGRRLTLINEPGAESRRK